MGCLVTRGLNREFQMACEGKDFKVLLAMVCWMLWKNQNSYVFQQKASGAS